MLCSWIAGEWREGPVRFADINPAHPQEVLEKVAGADGALTCEATEAASASFPSWSRTPSPVRARYLDLTADLLRERAKAIGEDLAREEGKTRREAEQEVLGAAAQFRYAAGRALEPDGSTVASSDPSITLLMARREPIGPVACITPWNFPIAIPAWKISHALAAGDTVVWKPSELTPMTSVHLTRCLADAGIPAGVVNVVLGEGPLAGRSVVQADGIRGVSFTGSNRVGAEVAQEAARRGLRCQLELGGKNPTIVLADADLDQAARQVAEGAFLSSGQKCTATSKVAVQRPAFDELAARLSETAENWSVGDPLDETTMIGPLVSEGQYRHVIGLLSSVPETAQILAGGLPPTRPPDAGFYVKPTVLTDVPLNHPLSSQEIFGPVVVLHPVDNYSEAVRVANDTPFGLSASIFTADLSYALRFVQDSEAGVVKVNRPTTGNEPHVPFGGHKDSGNGPPEMGWTAVDFFTQWKTAYIRP